MLPSCPYPWLNKEQSKIPPKSVTDARAIQRRRPGLWLNRQATQARGDSRWYLGQPPHLGNRKLEPGI